MATLKISKSGSLNIDDPEVWLQDYYRSIQGSESKKRGSNDAKSSFQGVVQKMNNGNAAGFISNVESMGILRLNVLNQAPVIREAPDRRVVILSKPIVVDAVSNTQLPIVGLRLPGPSSKLQLDVGYHFCHIWLTWYYHSSIRCHWLPYYWSLLRLETYTSGPAH